MHSEELEKRRREEIVDACEKLHAASGFAGTTLKDIARETSMSRPSVYNYFRTKEEIFLALFAREYDRWNADLAKLAAARGPLPPRTLADRLAATLEPRGLLLRLLSMNIYDMEAGSRVENLVAFKKSYGASIRLVEEILAKHAPGLGARGREAFVWAFFPFLFGVHPYTAVTDKQREAMAAAGVAFPYPSVRRLVRDFALRLLSREMK